MAEYINKFEMRSAVCRGCNEEFSDEPCEPSCCHILQEIKRIPTADVVEVVRCKDCKHFVEEEFCMGIGIICRFDDFCSYGERKETDNE